MAVQTTEEFLNGGATSYTITIEYLQASDIKVRIGGTLQTYTTGTPGSGEYSVSGTTVTLGAAAPSGSGNVHIYRETDVNTAAAVFAAGSSIRAADLNAIHDMGRFAAVEHRNQVITANIKDGQVTTAKIAADNITSALIADDQIDSEHYVADSIDSEHYAPGSVDTAAIGAQQVTTNELATDSVNTTKIIDLNVTRAKIAADAIDASKLADDSVYSEHIVDGQVSTNEIADGCITAAKMGTNSVGSGAISSGAVGSSEINNDAVTIEKINDDVIVTAAEQATAASNDTSFLTVAAADARFFNVSTGDTIKDGQTFPDNDTTIATTAAINDRIIDLVDDVGGFVPIANETSFPTTNPDINLSGSAKGGTIVSVKTVSTDLVPSGTTVTIANGRGTGNAVIITGVPSTIPSGFGFLAETTTTDHTYAFHRLTPKATEVTTVAGNSSNITTVANNNANVTTVATNIASVNTTAGDIANVNTTAGNIANVNTVATNIANVNLTGGSIANVNTTAGSIANVNTTATNIASVNNASANINSINNFGDTYQVHSNNPTTDGGGNALAAGDLYFDTSANELKVYNGSAWQGGVTATGNFAVVTGNTFTGDNRYNDGVKLNVGTGSDLEIYHDGTDSYIENNTGNLFINYGNDKGVKIEPNAKVQLFYDNGLKLETLSTGAKVYGNITVTGNVDGRDLAADGTKLDGIETGATADGGSNGTDYNDNTKIRLGTGNDLELYHTGTHSFIDNGTGQLYLRSPEDIILAVNNTENGVVIKDNAAVELYYDGNKKLNTAGFGVKILGEIDVEDADPKIYLSATSGTDYYFHNDAGTFKLRDEADSNAVRYQLGADGVHYIYGDTNVMGTSDLTVKGGDLKLESNSKKLQLGASQDLEIYFDGTHSRLKHTPATGDLVIQSDDIYLTNAAGNEYYFRGIKDGAAELFYDNSKKFETTSAGATVTGDLIVLSNFPTLTLSDGDHNPDWTFYNGNGTFRINQSTNNINFLSIDTTAYWDCDVRIPHDDHKLKLGAGNDLEIYHDGLNSYVANVGTGNMNINGSTVQILNPSATEVLAKFIQNAAVELYYDNDKKVETFADGLSVKDQIQFKNTFGSSPQEFDVRIDTDGRLVFDRNGDANQPCLILDDDTDGQILIPKDNQKLKLGDSGDLSIYHDGTNSVIKNATNDLYVTCEGDDLVLKAYDDVNIQPDNGDNGINVIGNGAVELYHDNSLKLATTGSGVNVTGSVTATSFVGSGAGLTGISAIPTGMVAPFAQGSVPSGWLECNGNSVSRSTYADLFSAIGTTYGAGNGSTTFQVPELRGEFIRGLDNSRGIDSGRANGSFQDHGIPAMKGHIADAHGNSRINTWAETGYTNVFDGVGTSSWRTSIHAVSGNYASLMFDSTNVIPASTHVQPRNVAMMYCIKT